VRNSFRIITGAGCILNYGRGLSPKRWLVVLIMLCLAGAQRQVCAADTSDAVLDLLLQKGIITEGEAAKIKAQAAANATNPPPQMPESKWKLGEDIKDVQLFGDIRTRYERRDATDPYGGGIDLHRFRYAVRLGLRGDLFEDYYYGVRLETASNPRSPWVTAGSSTGGAPYQGPFGKSNAGIAVGQAYAGWRPGDWADITIGKMPQPLYTTPMVWDSDFNPEGLAEHFKYTIGEADLFANLAQFIYQDTSPNEASPGYFSGLPYTSSSTTFLLAWQAGVNYRFTTNLTAKIAPVLYSYTSHGVNNTTASDTPGFNGTFIGQGLKPVSATAPIASSGYSSGFYSGFAANQTGLNDLLILEIPMEVDFKTGNLKLRWFGDYAQNLEGRQRAQAAFNAQSQILPDPTLITAIPSPQLNDTKAYQIGFGIGSGELAYGPTQGLVYGTGSRKNAWEFRAYWQHIEQYALDPNLIDSDFFEGRANLEGVYAAVAYGLSANMIATFRYGYAHRINDNLGTGGSNQDIPQINPIESFNLLQVDLTFRF
jgi:hypothetical protein